MNRQEEVYFERLSENRKNLANALEAPALRGVRHSVVDKYSDQAHFIYELLQNADDACATTAKFVLEKERLIFIHNGTRHFSISNPENEDVDSEMKRIGDINAITSIANSSKTGASIGKFGVGFKAVFQYTETPHIYDPTVCFKIERFIVPVKIDGDYPGRGRDETVFVFPFDHPERSADEAFEDISGKLKNLSYPLLFLSNLKNIEFEFGDFLGLYDKKIEETILYGETKAEHLVLTQNDGDEIYDEYLWLFSRKYDRGEDYADDERYLTYAAGFFIDEEDCLVPVDEPAFCFFPTKEETHLNFIIHAPFLLTDSREGIRAGIAHNDAMIHLLAGLAADALEYLRDIGLDKDMRLIDDEILSIIPINTRVFSDPSNKSRISFFPFYESIREKFIKAEILPANDEYVSAENAYWASVPQIAQLFSNEQLADIVENKNAHWVFVSLGREGVQRNKRELFSYIDSIVRAGIDEGNILAGRSRDFYVKDGVRQSLVNIRGISASFIEKQSFEWLHSFYQWISETKSRRELIKSKPVFIDQNGRASAAFDQAGQAILFLPVDNIPADKLAFVNEKLLDNKDTFEFIEQFGIKQPSLRDQIYNIILPQYLEDGEIDTDPHFELFFEYYCKCSYNEVVPFLQLIRDCEFLTFYEPGDEQPYRGAAGNLYFPTEELVAFYEGRRDIRFVALDEYKELVGNYQTDNLLQFLSALGVKSEVSLIQRTFEDPEGRNDIPKPYYTRYRKYEETVIDGCKEVLEEIEANKDEKKSLVLWKCLLGLAERTSDVSTMLRGKCNYFYKKNREESFDSSDTIRLRTTAWLMNDEGEMVKPADVSVRTLARAYDTESSSARKLITFLKISEESKAKIEDDSNLTENQRKMIAIASKLKEYGIENDEDLEEFREYIESKRRKEVKTQEQGDSFTYNSSNSIRSDSEETDLTRKIDMLLFDAQNEDSDDVEKKDSTKKKVNVIKDILEITKEPENEKAVPAIDEDIDEDEYIPRTVDYRASIKRKKEKSAVDIEKIIRLEELQNKAKSYEPYSFGWFRTLLEMESIQGGDSNVKSKDISISFGKIEPESGKERTLVLKYPDKHIPQYIEDLENIPMILHMGDQMKTVEIEVSSIQSYTLRVKMKDPSAIDGIDLREVGSVTIKAKSSVFLLEELKKQFEGLSFEDSFNMQKNLCENIEFIFGPPGTGKTTYLAQNVLIPLMQEKNECKVLVLAPTNKAADVLVRRIMELKGDDHTYRQWLIRFGSTGEEEIEKSQIFREKTFDISKKKKHVTVTTVARFPYDFFMPKGGRIHLRSIAWDYIVIDEASMIPLVNIILPLYMMTPEKFIIAGDPFQIQPITSVITWKDENIYSMVKLESFTNPDTVPHHYDVKLLTTQYRSIPDIGNIYSGFLYGGVLQHARTIESQRTLNVGNDLGIETLNLIKFPVSKYESIYRCKRLLHSSSYQIYSALFTFEYVCYLAKAIAANNPGESYSMGVIAPYRAQADLINKLMASERMPKGIEVEVGTIHGFQGDECDIIFAVFNTPPSISSSKDMFLNKENIINVSISRARDYLFVVMPDDNTENISKLTLVKKVEGLIRNTDVWNEFLTPDLEDLMFGDSKYLEKNSFATSHQSVNVYGLPENCYEIRSEDTAVDVQVHKEMKEKKEGESKRENVDIVGKGKDYSDPAQLNEELIPEGLRSTAIDLPVNGALNGWCYLVPYEGKLNEYTTKTRIPMMIPVIREGQEKIITVSVAEEDRIIYISDFHFKIFEQELSEPEGINLRR